MLYFLGSFILLYFPFSLILFIIICWKNIIVPTIVTFLQIIDNGFSKYLRVRTENTDETENMI